MRNSCLIDFEILKMVDLEGLSLLLGKGRMFGRLLRDFRFHQQILLVNPKPYLIAALISKYFPISVKSTMFYIFQNLIGLQFHIKYVLRSSILGQIFSMTCFYENAVLPESRVFG